MLRRNFVINLLEIKKRNYIIELYDSILLKYVRNVIYILFRQDIQNILLEY